LLALSLSKSFNGAQFFSMFLGKPAGNEFARERELGRRGEWDQHRRVIVGDGINPSR